MSMFKRRDLHLLPSTLSRLRSSIAVHLHVPFSQEVVVPQRWKHTSPGENGGENGDGDGGAVVTDVGVEVGSALKTGFCNPSTWRIYNSRKVGINKSAISQPVWAIIRSLQEEGFEAYLVGGCVRDLLLKRVPKDFDVTTTATNRQIKRQFRRCIIVGRRFPICQVHMVGSIIEVSSFHTNGQNEESKEGILHKSMHACNEKDLVRWKNSMHRDFTINGLFFDPVKSRVYDYVNGLRDLKLCKVNTVVSAHLSFSEDCARILRGLRIAARLGFHFSEETKDALNKLSPSISTLTKPRLLMELNFMLAYGAARPSILLLKRYGLLEILMPFHAAYLDHQRSKYRSDYIRTMFMKLLSSMDNLLFTDRPCDCTLWFGLLAFHIALVKHPQETSVVWAFSSLLYFGTWPEAMASVKQFDANANAVNFLPEIRSEAKPMSEEMLKEQVLNLASLIRSSVCVLSCVESLQEYLTMFPEAPELSGQVFLSAKKENQVAELFELNSENKRQQYDINYKLLKKGDPDETRFVIGKVIMDTLTAEATPT